MAHEQRRNFPPFADCCGDHLNCTEYLPIPGCKKAWPQLLAMGYYRFNSGANAYAVLLDFRQKDLAEKRLIEG
jgi:hypothetical protein